jgi:hypothetical protein
MPLLIGISWLLAWLLLKVFNVAIDKAMLVTAIVFILLGLLYDRPWEGWKKP